ncbi:MAG: hypothetical protein V2A67_12200 [Bacteroidota bacterium]
MGNQTKPFKSGTPPRQKEQQEFMASVLSRPLLRIVADYYDEIEAKSQAYRFILEKGLQDEFREYCATDNSSR